MQNQAIIFFDGVCNLCNESAQFVLLRDKRAHFQFASLQSETAKRMLPSERVRDLDSVVLIEDGKLYTQSTAVLRICRRLPGGWPLLSVFLVVPRPVRDAVYAWVGRNRYRWFGKSDACLIPKPEWKNRFLD